VACHFGGLKTLLAVRRVSKTFRSGAKDTQALAAASTFFTEEAERETWPDPVQ
jgi:hypothetical protein